MQSVFVVDFAIFRESFVFHLSRSQQLLDVILKGFTNDTIQFVVNHCYQYHSCKKLFVFIFVLVILKICRLLLTYG